MHSDQDRSTSHANLSKSKQALKKCIDDISTISNMQNSIVGKAPGKLAAPKPVRARPQALSQIGNSKWIQTSPVKAE